MSIKLNHFSEEHVNQLNSFQLPDEQKQFTALPNEIFEIKEGQYRIVILNGNEPVGFFILHETDRVKNYSDNPKAMLLTAFSINHAHQGNGYAKHGLLLLRGFVQNEFPNCNEIVLAVNHKNVPAQRLYLKVGFNDTGLRKIGPKGEQFVMKLSLQDL